MLKHITRIEPSLIIMIITAFLLTTVVINLFTPLTIHWLFCGRLIEGWGGKFDPVKIFTTSTKKKEKKKRGQINCKCNIFITNKFLRWFSQTLYYGESSLGYPFYAWHLYFLYCLSERRNTLTGCWCENDGSLFQRHYLYASLWYNWNVRSEFYINFEERRISWGAYYPPPRCLNCFSPTRL